MTTPTMLCSHFLRQEEGQDLIEYALLAALISVIAVLAIQAVGTKITTSYTNIRTSIP